MNKKTRMTAATTRPASPTAHTHPCTKIERTQIKIMPGVRVIDWIMTRVSTVDQKKKERRHAYRATVLRAVFGVDDGWLGLGLGREERRRGRAGRLLLLVDDEVELENTAGLYMTGAKVDDAGQAQWHAAAQCPTMVADRALR